MKILCQDCAKIKANVNGDSKLVKIIQLFEVNQLYRGPINTKNVKFVKKNIHS